MTGLRAHWKKIATALAVIAALYFGWRFTRDDPETFRSAEMQFKYGSTGGDKFFGIPFAVWQVLPILFKDRLPKGREDKGWAALGFISEDFKEGDERPRHRRPIGTTMRNYMGLERVFLNCAACHAGAVRAEADAPPQIVLGMPANTVDLEAFQNFLVGVADDPRFTARDVLKAIDDNDIDLDVINRLALRFIGIKQMKDLIHGIGERFKFTESEPAFGPGRFDTFSPAKALMNWPRDGVPPHERIGVVDFPSVWRQSQKQGMWLHWDGNNDKVEERNRSAAFGTGANFPILDRKSVRRMEAWVWTAQSPSFAQMLDVTIDEPKAAQGKVVYEAQCAACHGASGTEFKGGSVGRTTPISAIGTDRFRFDNYSYDLMLNQATLYAGNAEERFQNFRKSDGYANMPLDGLWLRAPYLHNGSVPTLRDLLKPAAERPGMFYRGSTIYDSQDMGFASKLDQIPEAERKHVFCYATNAQGLAQCGADAPDNRGTCAASSCKGNGNGGHEYGTSLAPSEKDALIEYLKTF
jgi:mono/diheme cytochrome c family protein